MHLPNHLVNALTEYHEIVTAVASEYTDETTGEELRADHPELDFMDSGEIEDVLKYARIWRGKS